MVATAAIPTEINNDSTLSISDVPSREPRDIRTTYLPVALIFFNGGGSISAILRRQSASEACGPETNVPLTFVLYQHRSGAPLLF
jgi:hypothetical protein